MGSNGIIILVVGFGIKTFSGGSDSNSTTPTKETTLSKDEKLIEIRKEYWKNKNLKSEVPYKKYYGLGWEKVKTTMIPHGIALCVLLVFISKIYKKDKCERKITNNHKKDI